jgi:hypothetical protein
MLLQGGGHKSAHSRSREHSTIATRDCLAESAALRQIEARRVDPTSQAGIAENPS